jgi:hypothetical protein
MAEYTWAVKTKILSWHVGEGGKEKSEREMKRREEKRREDGSDER